MPRRFADFLIPIAILAMGLAAPQQALSQAPVDTAVLDADDSTEPAETDESADPAELADPAETEVPDEAAMAVDEFDVEPVVAAEGFPNCSCGGKCVVCDKKRKAAVAAKVKDAYKGVFYANDYSYLSDPCYQEHYPGDALKQLSVHRDGKLDLGGEIRVRYHDEENIRGLGLTGRDDEFWLTRLRLFANYRVNDWMRVYGEFLYADSGGQTFPSRGIEVNRGEAQNLFVDVKLFDTGSSKVVARGGRQELLYGNQRLVSPLDWGNTRRTFEGYKLMYISDDWNIDGFIVNPFDPSLATRSTRSGADTNVDFWGLYGTKSGFWFGSLDLYYLGLSYDEQNVDRQTFGSRVAGNYGETLYEMERALQFGNSQGGSDDLAAFFTAGLGRKLNLSAGGVSWKPTIWGWYDYASGEENFANASALDNSFDQLFPLGHKYLGFMDLFGRRNLHDFNTQLITPVSQRVTLLLWYHYFMLAESTTPYNVNGSAFNTTTAAASRDLGHEIDFLATIALNPRNSLLLGYSFFDSGDYYTQTSNGVAGTNGIPSTSDAQFFYAQYQMQF